MSPGDTSIAGRWDRRHPVTPGLSSLVVRSSPRHPPQPIADLHERGLLALQNGLPAHADHTADDLGRGRIDRARRARARPIALWARGAVPAVPFAPGGLAAAQIVVAAVHRPDLRHLREPVNLGVLQHDDLVRRAIGGHLARCASPRGIALALGDARARGVVRTVSPLRACAGLRRWRAPQPEMDAPGRFHRGFRFLRRCAFGSPSPGVTSASSATLALEVRSTRRAHGAAADNPAGRGAGAAVAASS